MTISQYLIQTCIFQFFFLIIYDVLHKKDTFFNINRSYLLATPILSFILPFIKLPAFKTATSQVYVSQLERVLLSSSEGFLALSPEKEQNPINWLLILYFIGLAVSFLVLILKLHKLKIIRAFSLETIRQGVKITLLPNSKQAFSFLNTIYLGDALNESEKKNILMHEVVHVAQKHSIDQLWFEILKTIFWWNPIIYLFQSRITIVHEYIADAIVVHKISKKKYIQQLLNATFQTQEITFVNQFFNQSLIKKRILMLQKTQSKTYAKLKYLCILPFLAGMLIYTSCNASETEKEATQIEKESQPIATSDAITKAHNEGKPTCPNQQGKYDRNLDNFLKLTSGQNAEVIVNIISEETSKSVRVVHLKRDQTRYVRNIPEGKYEIHIAYGEGYSEKTEGGRCIAFFKNEKFTETGGQTLDFYTIKTDQGRNVPSYNLVLDVRDEDIGK